MHIKRADVWCESVVQIYLNGLARAAGNRLNSGVMVDGNSVRYQ